VSADPDSVRELLREHGDRLRIAERSRREEHAAIAELLFVAIDAGLNKSEIARLSGVSRPWIDRILQRRT
jgi:hypothetical protein